MKNMRMMLAVCVIAVLGSLGFEVHAADTPTKPVILENRDFKLVLGGDAVVRSLVHKPTGEECLAPGLKLPAFSITQNRPYDNELQLSYPAKSKTFPAKSVIRKGDKLIVEFELVSHIATIDLKITDSYIGFVLEKLDYRIEDYGIKRVTAVDEFMILQLPVKERRNYGDWLNVLWDEKCAVNLLATCQHARIDAHKRSGYRVMCADALRDIKVVGVGCALIVSRPNELLDRIQSVEEDYDLPRGVESRRRPEYKYSYYELRGGGKLLETIDKNIEYAKKGGFRSMVVYWPDFAKTAGHFEWRKEYPDGIKDLKLIVDKIKAAGMVPGLHIHYNKANLKDSYVSPVPDHRLNLRRIFTLAGDLDLNSDTVVVEEDPAGCTMEKGRRYLKIGKELITYEGFSSDNPRCFNGCKRGALGSTVAKYETGAKFGLLDVDTWPIFVRFDQRTSIQKEVAERLGKLWNEAGFQFVYFDGAEDVHPPYWFHVSNSQYELYKALDPKPLLSEGAMKTHFSWHMLTRGNAFDHFPPEVIKEATCRYPLSEAKHVFNDFTSLNFGWMSYVSPSKKTIGTQPDMYEFVTSHAAGWDCPVSLAARLDHMDRHPRTPDNFEVLKRWEDVRNSDYLTEERKLAIRDPQKEHILLLDEKGAFELQEYEQIKDAACGCKEMRAFIFERKGNPVVVYWHPFGAAKAVIKADPAKVKLFKNIGSPLPLKNVDGGVELPLTDRHYIEFRGSREEAIKLIRSAQVVSIKE